MATAPEVVQRRRHACPDGWHSPYSITHLFCPMCGAKLRDLPGKPRLAFKIYPGSVSQDGFAFTSLEVRNAGTENYIWPENAVTTVRAEDAKGVKISNLEAITANPILAPGGSLTLNFKLDLFELSLDKDSVDVQLEILNAEQIPFQQATELELGWKCVQTILVRGDDAEINVCALGVTRFVFPETSDEVREPHQVVFFGGSSKVTYDMFKQADGTFAVDVPIYESCEYWYQFDGNETNHRWYAVENTKLIHLRNMLNSPVDVEVKPTGTWTVTNTTKVKLLPRSKASCEVQIQLERLPHGEFSSCVEFFSAQELIASFPVNTRAHAFGPIPECRVANSELGVLTPGVPVHIVVEVRNVGSGDLQVQILTTGSLETDKYETYHVSPNWQTIPVTFTPRRGSRGASEPQLLLECNTLMPQRRCLPIVLHYQLQSLQALPSEIKFGDIYPGGRFSRTLQLSGQGGGPVACELELKEIPSWMEVELKKTELQVQIDGNKLGDHDRSISGNIVLQAKEGALYVVVSISAHFVCPRITADTIDIAPSRRVRSRVSIPCRNTGNGMLLIHRIVVAGRGLNLAASSYGNFPLELVLDSSLQERTPYRGEIRILSNDPRFPEIVLPVVCGKQRKASSSNGSSGPIALSPQFVKQILDSAQLAEIENKWNEEAKRHRRHVKIATLAGLALGALTLLYPMIAERRWERNLRTDGNYLLQFEEIEHVLSSDRYTLPGEEVQFRNELSIAQKQVEMLRTRYDPNVRQSLDQQLCKLTTLCSKLKTGWARATPRESIRGLPPCPMGCRID